MDAIEQMPVGQARYYHDKKAFIHSQIRLLEAPIRPSVDWRRHRPRLTAKGETQASIPDSVLSAVLSKLHATSTKSLRLSFNNQSVRQLLEQLESNQHELHKKARQGGIIIRTKSVQDILGSDWIDMFPVTWQHGQDSTGFDPHDGSSSTVTPLVPTVSPSRLQKYAQLRARVVTLQTKFQALKDKTEYYKALQIEIRTLDAGQIQKNVLMPNSQILKELQKMKELLPKTISILSSRRDILSAKREHRSLHTSTDDRPAKRLQIEPSNPFDTMMDCFQD